MHQRLLQLQPRQLARHRAEHLTVCPQRPGVLRGRGLGPRRVAAARTTWPPPHPSAPSPTTRTPAGLRLRRVGWHTTYQQLWQDLYNGGADVVLNGDSHWYERFAPLNASGAIDNATGSANSSWVPVGPPGHPRGGGPDQSGAGQLHARYHEDDPAQRKLRLELRQRRRGAFTDSGRPRAPHPGHHGPTDHRDHGPVPSAGWYTASTTVT